MLDNRAYEIFVFCAILPATREGGKSMDTKKTNATSSHTRSETRREKAPELIDLVTRIKPERPPVDLVTRIEPERPPVDLVTRIEPERPPVDLVTRTDSEQLEQQIFMGKEEKGKKAIGFEEQESGEKTKIQYVNTETNSEEETLGNFSLRIVKRVQEVEEKEEGMVAKVFYISEIILKSGEIFHAKVPGSQISNPSWIIEQSGGAAHFSIGKEVKGNVIKQIYEQIDSEGVRREIRFLQNGWKYLNGKWIYVIHDGAIGDRIDGVYGDVEHKFCYDERSIGTRVNFSETMGMLDICEDRSVSLPLFLFTHMGALTKLFELAKFPPKMVIAIIGPTNSRKTSMALCMTKTFGRENITEPEIAFDSTAGGIEVRSSKHADSVFLVDDYHPAITGREKTRLDGNLAFVLRRYGDRTSVKRMTDFAANKDVGQYPVTGVCLITGEDIGGVQSSLTRVLCLNVTKHSVQNDVLAYYQEKHLILNTHMHSFIRYISQNFTEIVNLIAEEVKRIRAEKLYAVPRFAEYEAQFLVVAKIFGRYAKWMSFWNDEDVEMWLHECETVMGVVIEQNLRGVMAEDFGVMVMKALHNAINVYGCIELQDYAGRKIGDRQILFDTEFFYVTVDFLLEETRRFWQKFGRMLPFSSVKQLTQFLMERDLILVKKEGKDTRRTLPLPGRKQRVLYVRKEKMQEVLDQIEW